MVHLKTVNNEIKQLVSLFVEENGTNVIRNLNIYCTGATLDLMMQRISEALHLVVS